MKTLTVSLFTLLILTSLSAEASKFCQDLLPKTLVTSESSQSATNNFLSLLNELYRETTVGEEELKRLSMSENILVNPISSEKAKISMAMRMQFDLIESHLKNQKIEVSAIQQWASEKLALLGLDNSDKAKMREETAVTEYPLEFAPVRAGMVTIEQPTYFSFGQYFKPKVRVRLTHDFEMSTTVVTQHQWADLMRFNPSQFRYDDEESMVSQAGITMQPNFPVERVDIIKAFEFANLMSIKAGLRPAYIIDTIKHTQTLGYKVTINAPDQDIYRAEGYRLPTNAEMVLMLSHYRKRFPGNSLPRVLRRSIKSTHDVKAQEPVSVDGHLFYDLYDNVMVWTNDSTNAFAHGEVDPQTSRQSRIFSTGANLQTANGADFLNRKNYVFSSMGENLYGGSKGSVHVGLRLVRSLHPEQRRSYPELSTDEFLQTLRPIKMNVVKAGTFGPDGYSDRFRLTKNFELAETPITQGQWVQVMGENPADFTQGSNSRRLIESGHETLLQPDNPVEGITWWAAMEFSNRLSEAHGMTPYYDLSEVSFDPETRAENGTLALKNKDDFLTELKKVKFRSKPWFSFSFEPFKAGYRLPMVAELEYLVFHRSPHKVDHFNGKWVGYSLPVETYGFFEAFGEKFSVNIYPELTLDTLISNSYAGPRKNPIKMPTTELDRRAFGGYSWGPKNLTLRLARDAD